MARLILVVDDSNSMRSMVVHTLVSSGYSVVEAKDGQDGLTKLDATPKVDLVLTDLNMPVMDGITLIKHIRTRPAHKFTPLLMLTTEAQPERKAEGKSAGATGWLVKPFDPVQLLNVIKKVLP